MREIGMAEEREGIPSLCCGASYPLCLGFGIIVYKRQDGDRFGCDLRQSLVMPLNELLRHNRVSTPTPGKLLVGDPDFPEGSAEPGGSAPLSGRQDVVEPEGIAPLVGG